MSRIEFRDVCVTFPVFSIKARSIKNSSLSLLRGGKIVQKEKGLQVKALEGISFECNDGDRVGIVGKNGSGKTTLLRCIQGIYEPTSGVSIVSGRIGSLIDITLGMEAELTGRENIFLRSKFLGLSNTEVRKSLDQIVSFSELENFIDFPIRTYSSGMLLRLAFSVVTAFNFDIILMDEWLTVGDQGFSRKAEERLKSMLTNSRILVVATHSETLLRAICNRAILLDSGTIVCDDSPEEVANRVSLEF